MPQRTNPCSSLPVGILVAKVYYPAASVKANGRPTSSSLASIWGVLTLYSTHHLRSSVFPLNPLSSTYFLHPHNSPDSTRGERRRIADGSRATDCVFLHGWLLIVPSAQFASCILSFLLNDEGKQGVQPGINAPVPLWAIRGSALSSHPI